MKKWEVDGEKVVMWVDNARYYCTNDHGCGVFLVNLTWNERKQLTGTCQFTVRGIKPESKIAKLRKWLSEEVAL